MDIRKLMTFFVAVTVVVAIITGCASVRTLRQIEQPVGSVLTTGIGGTLLRLNKVGDLPNVVGGRDIYGGKVDKGFAEVKLAGIEGQSLLLEVFDINRQSSETTMDRYKPYQRNTLVNVEVENKIELGHEPDKPYQVNLDITKQRDIVIAGVRITFIEVQPYSVRYTLEDIQPK